MVLVMTFHTFQVLVVLQKADNNTDKAVKYLKSILYQYNSIFKVRKGKLHANGILILMFIIRVRIRARQTLAPAA